jgi:chromosome segregation ATPase
MEPTDITIEILKSIREELRDTRTELKEGISTLSRRVVESEVRTATAVTDMHGTLRDVRDLLREQLDLRPRLERCERDIGELRQQIFDR